MKKHLFYCTMFYSSSVMSDMYMIVYCDFLQLPIGYCDFLQYIINFCNFTQDVISYCN